LRESAALELAIEPEKKEPAAMQKMQLLTKRFSRTTVDLNNPGLFPKPADRLARQIDPHALHLRVEFQSLLAHLAAVA